MIVTLALIALLAAGPVFAQTPPTQTPPPQTTPPPTQTTPPPTQTTPPPTQTPPPPTPPPTQTPPPKPPAGQTPPPLPVPQQKPAAEKPAPKPPAPFPADAKFGFVNLQVIVNESNLGKAGTDQIKKLQEKLNAGLAARQKELQGLGEKIKTQQGVVEERILVGWGRDLERLQRDFQNAQQDAQVQVDQLTQDLLNNFEKQVLPHIEAIRTEKNLWVIFAIPPQQGDTPPGLQVVAAAPGLDLSLEIVKRLNAVVK
jgi:Skp family chaperone for outer membrane proteins